MTSAQQHHFDFFSHESCAHPNFTTMKNDNQSVSSASLISFSPSASISSSSVPIVLKFAATAGETMGSVVHLAWFLHDNNDVVPLASPHYFPFGIYDSWRTPTSRLFLCTPNLLENPFTFFTNTCHPLCNITISPFLQRRNV
jgi:hypothetical protein